MATGSPEIDVDASLARPTRWPKGRVIVAVLLLLAAHIGFAVDGARRQAVTLDEFAHLPAGISYWQTGDFFLYHHNPPLIKMLAALPVMAMQPDMPYDEDFRYVPGRRFEAAFGRAFMEANPDRHFEFFVMARMVIVALSATGAILIFVWSRELFGDMAGLLSLAVWCSSPMVLGHAQLVTPDIGASIAGLAAVYAFRGFLQRPSAAGVIPSGIALGLAELSKFTLLVLYPVFGILATVRLLKRTPCEPEGFQGSHKSFLGQCFGMAALSLWVLNAGYGFEGTFQRLGDFHFGCRALSVPVPYPTPTISGLRQPILWHTTLWPPRAAAQALCHRP